MVLIENQIKSWKTAPAVATSFSNKGNLHFHCIIFTVTGQGQTLCFQGQPEWPMLTGRMTSKKICWSDPK